MGGFHSVSKWYCGKQQFLDTYFLHHQQILIHKIATLYLVPRKYIISLGFRKYPVIWNLACYSLACRAHSNDYGLVTPYSHRNSNQHWLEYGYLLCYRCQSITWIIVDLFFYEQKQTKVSCTQWWLVNFTSIFTGFCWCYQYPDSKVHVAHPGPTWVLSAPDGPNVGPMNLVIRVVLTF